MAFNRPHQIDFASPQLTKVQVKKILDIKKEHKIGEKTMKKILVVDDQPMNRAVLSEMLNDYEVLEAENGIQALELLKEEPSLILLDTNMPEMDGFELMEELNNRGDETTVIFISSDSNQDAIVKAYQLGALNYITRPFDSVVMKLYLDRVIDLISQIQ